MVGSDMETFGEDTFPSNLPCVLAVAQLLWSYLFALEGKTHVI